MHVHDDHDHGHHHHGPADYGLAFAVGISLNVVFVGIEAVFGYWAHSLALLADAGHNLSDVLGLLIAWGALHLAKTRPTERRTYGLRRSSILAAVFNAVVLLIAIGAIAWEAVGRFVHPAPVAGATVMVVAGIGIVINGLTAALFASGRKSDVNIEGAFLHMAADAAVSVGVLVAGAVILYAGWTWLDPVVSLLIVLVIAIGTWDLLRRSFDLAMDAVPAHIDPAAVRDYLSALPGVSDIHDFHIWAMSTTETALTAHLIRSVPELDDAFLHDVSERLHHEFHIHHVTIQIESGHGPQVCHLSHEDSV